jgi:lipid-A-disaccharide synthase-like uncharacterized protein
MTSWFHLDSWAFVGLLGQVIFGSRFYVQLIASERRKQSHFPLAFWYLSIAGGVISLIYAVHIGSLAFTLGQAGGLVVYLRNLMLIRRRGGATPSPA